MSSHSKENNDNELPEGRCAMEITLPPIQGTTLRAQSLLFSSIGVCERSTPLCSEAFSASEISLALSVNKNPH